MNRPHSVGAHFAHYRSWRGPLSRWLPYAGRLHRPVAPQQEHRRDQGLPIDRDSDSDRDEDCDIDIDNDSDAAHRRYQIFPNDSDFDLDSDTDADGDDDGEDDNDYDDEPVITTEQEPITQ